MSEQINVLYISYDGMTDTLGQSQVIPYLKGLTNEGFSFTILSCEKKLNFKRNQNIVRLLLEESSIKWEPIFYTKKPPVFSTIYDFLKLQVKAIELHKLNNFKIVHCRSYIPSLIGLKMKLKFQTKFIFDMRGFWADERVDGKLWNLNNPLFKLIFLFFKRSESRFLQNADAIVSLTERGKAEMLRWPVMRNVTTEINVISCCVDTDLFNPTQIKDTTKIQLREKLNIKPDDFVIGYLGSIGTWYMLDEMLDFFVDLKKAKPNAKFLFITFDEHDRILELAKNKDINVNDIIINPAARNDVPKILSILDYSIFFIKPTYSKISSSPVKQGEIMAMGIPVICNEGVGDTDSIVKKYKSGIVVKAFNYLNAIKDLDSFSTNKLMINEGAQEYFALGNGVQKYLNIYKDLIL